MISTKDVKKWKLLEPIKVGRMLFKNRMVMAPLLTCLATEDGSVTKETLDYYSERAKGAIAAIIVEYAYIRKEGQARPHQLGIFSDQLIPGLSQLAEMIKANGKKALLQIVHAGRQAPRDVTGGQAVAPSPVELLGEVPRELTLTEIEEIEDAFAEAARRGKQAGFDAIEIHGAHGYLVSEFLSPYTNKRTDEYGGALRNRARFALEVVKKVRDRVGTQFNLGFRMNGDDYVPGGITRDEVSKFAKMLQDASIDYIHVSAGMQDSIQRIIQPMYIEEASLVPLAELVKKAVKIPVITVGSLNVRTAEKALSQKKADIVAFGRSLLADPELADKLVLGRIEDIRPCIRGNEGCTSNVRLGRPIRCEVNPAAGREAEIRIVPAKIKKNVVVIGGGIAGMEAARIAALRGHKVTLFERGEKLGGHLVEASVPQFKDGIRQLVDWSLKQLDKGGITIKLESEVTPEQIRKLKPEVLIVAVGSDYTVPTVPGVDKPFVVTADDVLLNRKTIGERVVVIGGGLVGSETALYIAEKLKKSVVVVEMLDQIMNGVEVCCKKALMERLAKTSVEVHLGWRLERITDSGVICADNNGKQHKLEADTVVLAIGLVERARLVEKFKGLAPEVYVIGDCAEARNIYHAFEDAWRTTFVI
jgi:2,4-dienoyl-CoA reductase-like NADH-dependent reductase (Old Yellow Enzyme family)/thioredoxin reductase